MFIKPLVLVVFAFGMTLFSFDAHAFFCNRPSKPSLPNSYYADHDQMNSAQRDVETYSAAMKSYLECIAREHEEGLNEYRHLTMEWKNVVNAFNSR